MSKKIYFCKKCKKEVISSNTSKKKKDIILPGINIIKINKASYICENNIIKYLLIITEFILDNSYEIHILTFDNDNILENYINSIKQINKNSNNKRINKRN